MKSNITAEFGQVKLGDTLLPGVFESVEVSGALRIDEKDVPGSSGKRKQPMGYEDATFTLRLRLLTDETSTAYDKAKIIIALFQGVDKQAKPYVYRITNHLANLWKIKEVLFKDLKTRDSNKDDTLWADITLVEFQPVLVQAEAKAPVAASGASAYTLLTASGDTSTAAASAVSGQGSTTTGKQVASPAVDNDRVK